MQSAPSPGLPTVPAGVPRPGPLGWLWYAPGGREVLAAQGRREAAAPWAQRYRARSGR